VIEVARLGAELLRRVDTFAALAETAPGEGEARKAALRASLLRFLCDEAPEVAPALLAGVLETDLELNAQGLLWWLEHR
jgi:hypothetical protein